jgi:hypothetical protein
MTDLTLSFAPGTGQVIAQGPATGAAGAVALVPVPGLKLVFDRADGRLSRVVVDLAGAGEFAAVGESTLDERVAAMITRLFGAEAPALMLSVATAARPESRDARLCFPEPDLNAALSRLARLESARVTSPLQPGSPWWAAETADLARRAGLPELARVATRRTIAPLLGRLRGSEPLRLPVEAVSAVRTVAALGATTEPEMARRLLSALESCSVSPPAGAPTSTLDVAAEVAAINSEVAPQAGLQWTLDPPLTGSSGPFRPGLSPSSNLFVGQARGQAGHYLLTVEAQLARSADAGALSRYLVRVVDPEVTRVLARAPFGDAPDPSSGRSRAELSVAYPLDELKESWIEVVANKTQPVLSARGYRSRRALRWADAALRAERAPRGLAPRATADDWAALAAVAWERCRRDWASAGDDRRAQLARRRRDSFESAQHAPRPSSAAPGTLEPAPADGPFCLAEFLGG